MKKSKREWYRYFVCLLLGLFVISATLHAQEAIEKRSVTLDFKSAPLKDVLESIRKQTGMNFVYNVEQVASIEPVTIQAKQETVGKVLSRIFTGTGFRYEIKGKIVTLHKEEVRKMVQMLSLAKRKVQGTVYDTHNEPLPGVNIQVNGTRVGTTTEMDGRYTLILPDIERVELTFSFIGMEPSVVRYAGQTQLNVTLKEDSKMINEVVVTGLFNYRAESFTGSAVTYSKDDLQSVGNQNIIKSLQNLEPSFLVADNYLNGSNPNAFNDITIRGNASFTGLQSEYDGNPNEPLFVVDGFETTRQQVFDLDMNRVASVTVLKDAAAKAIYGAKAANGVVVVETVEPEKGRLRLTYTGDLNIEAPDLSSYDLCNAAEKLQVELNSGRYTATSPSYAQALREQYNNLLKNVSEGIDTYWLSKPLRTGFGQKHSVYMEGGDDRMRYSGSLGYNNIAGVMKGSNRNTLSGNIKLSYRYKNLLFRNSLSITSNKAEDSPYGSFSDYVGMNPYYSPYDANGNLQKLLGYYLYPATGSTPVYYYNPLYNASIGTNNFSKYTEYTENFYIEWRALESLRFTARVGYTYQTNTREDFYPGDHTKFATWTGDKYFKRGSYAISDGSSENLSADITANYSNHFGKHMLLANAAWSMNSSTSEKHGMTAWGFLNNHVDHISFAKQYADNGKPSGNEATTRSLGLTGALNYSYDDRYLADFTLRLNGSSVFGSDNRWGTFWSVGLGWNLHKEKFMKEVEFVNLFKLRASYGLTGSQNFNPYQAKATYKFYEDVVYDNIVGSYLMGMANDKLKWQQTAEMNMGFDLQLFKDLNIRFDAYRNKTKDALLSMTLPTSTGFSSYQENLGNVENKGYDATLSWRFFRNKHGYISANASVGHNVNKITKINDALKAFNEGQDGTATTSPVIRYEEGQSMTAIWAVRSQGIDPVNGQEIFLKKDGTTTYDWSAGDYVVAGDSNPKYHGNFGFSGEYKGIGLSCSFRYLLGGDYYNQTLVNRVENVNIANNVDRRVLHDTWQNIGDVATFKRITSRPNETHPTTRFIEKNNELQFASLSCYYDFKNQPWLKQAFMERLRVSFYMNDLFRISTVKTERGLDYPYARNFSFSLSATF
ncbi:TonB-linked SusC/RagA family outer membrane protein [Bacteroides reticulotermitis]|uniref:TonB-linked SusC/RagA family outer membrane protein n=1 Tax=Bacteroides reticulotermitis TaxID=1133319 RepID=A0A840CWW3_9BACE|nr:SusC/RagA family TonB-linked outer membrane protein [Bacteroides reticulotermitis]MBB4042588.1 TonB-linked SusC/RagA family outer membrane protein [Bacteroides reticulotermitis]